MVLRIFQPDLDNFKKPFGAVYLERSMSLDAAKLVLDCTFVLVDERLLNAYKYQFDMVDLFDQPDQNQLRFSVQLV
jgi:hypothetical protein